MTETEFLPASAGIVFPCLSLRQCTTQLAYSPNVGYLTLKANSPPTASKLGEPRATIHSIFQHTLTTFSTLLFTPFSFRIVRRRHVSLGYASCAVLHVLISPTTATTSSRSEPYDPYLPRGGSSANPSASGGNSGPNPKTAAIQAQIDDTVGIMRDNITKVVERQERLDSLQDKTGGCFSYALTTQVLPPLSYSSPVGVKPCQHDVDAHPFPLSFRQSCRFCSRLQA